MNDINVTTDDLVGILIHDANKAASHLSVNGLATDWVIVCKHLDRMAEIGRRIRAQVEMAMTHPPATSNGADAAAQSN